jgi:3-oxoacyl-[acyl-carrier protein] reductase
MSGQDHEPVDDDVRTNRLSRRRLLAAVTVAPAVIATSTSSAAAQATRGNGKAALVTGSSRGIGAAIAKRLARDGYAVTVNCVVNRDLAAGVVREIERAGGKAVWEQADVSDPTAIRRLFDVHQKAFGDLHVVVANAGIQRLNSFAQMSDEDYGRMVDVNMKGAFHTLREASRRVAKGGRIIALSSGTTSLRPPTYGAYAASKAAIEIFVNILAKELAGRMIAVNAIAPGTTNTTLFTNGKTPQEIAAFAAQTPHKRLGEPDDIANVVSILCGDRGWWVNGQVVHANGGLV